MTERVEGEFLPFVRRPARYIGGEINQIKKHFDACELRVALCFPDVYEVGMSHTGLAIIYDCLNKMEGVAAERCFSPWLEAEKILRNKKIPLFSLESKAALNSFDLLGFSLTNELCYTNVLNMLDLSGLKLRSCQRDEDDPLIIGGGNQANCCESMADFFDMFLLGEGEEAVVQLANFLKTEKEKGTAKRDVLLAAARKFKWLYVPQFYNFELADNKISKVYPIEEGIPNRLENAVVEDFEGASVPFAPIVPFVQAVHERVTVEIMRGCPGRCRFCQASFCRRPLRMRSTEKIFDIAKKCFHATGFDTVGLLSLSTGQYPNLEELVSKLTEYFQERHVGISLPSLRVDQQLKLIPLLAKSVRKSSLTIAVEAASERLREIINKPLKDEDLFAAVKQAWESGWGHIKLYFMVGLPGERQEDIKGIVELAFRLSLLRKQTVGSFGQINAAVSWFVPKPHTPFGFLGQKPRTYFEDAKNLILAEKRRLGAKFIHFKFHDIERSILESALGRGDRRLGHAIEAAFRHGARFDLWDECFNYAVWQNSFAEAGIDLDAAAQRQFEAEEITPWEQLGGPDKEYLLTHLKEAMALMNPQV